MKILSPAGNFECLKMAVFNGADEVYLGINEFNARNNIDGFTLETLETAVDFAHLYGVKVYLAINILFSDEELQSAFDTVVKAYNMGVDAFIVQDLALAHTLHSNFPQIELHASTQMGIHNLEGVNAILPFGFKRVVLARETPLSEIKRIKENVNVEIEYFGHGALCVSFSGNCYLSSYLNSASGNRGRCKQLCRLPYELIKGGRTVKKGYLLSAKDFQMVDKLSDLEKAGVDAIKIEGRARRAYYVATATREYRKALDGLKIDKDKLKLAFNRGFTEGYFNGNGNIISDIQNHIGVNVGEVIKVKNGKNFNEIFITSNRKLSPKSTFKLFNDKKESAVITAYDLKEIKDGVYRITTTTKIKVGEKINLISDFELENQTLNEQKKIPVQVLVSGAIGKNAKFSATLNDKTVAVEGEELLPAQNQPLDVLQLTDNFSKSEYFVPTISFDCNDKVFIPKGKLNELRRSLYTALYDRVTAEYKHDLALKNIELKNIKVNKFSDFEYVEDLDCEFIKKNVIYSPEEYSVNDVKAFVAKCASLDKEPYLDTPNFVLEKDIELLKSIINETGVKIVANNYYALTFSCDKVIGPALNVYNSHCASLYRLPVMTAESFVSERVDYPYMTLRHCPLKSHDHSSCDKCTYSGDIKLKMESGKVMRLKRKKLSTCTFYLTD